MKPALSGIAFLALTALPLAATAKTPPAFHLSKLMAYQAAETTTQGNLKTLDTFDFDVQSNQKSAARDAT